MVDRRRAAIDRFTRAAEGDALVAAAFLGGSLAAGKEDEFSDLDLYVVARDEDYERFFAHREDFVRSWADPVFLDTSRNFQGFGFDMLHFVLADGVSGEVALGHQSNMLVLHGGPHRVLVDKATMLEAVTFPLFEPPAEEQRKESERAATWFWLSVIELAKFVGRGRLASAQFSLGRMRERLELLVEAGGASKNELADIDQDLLATYVPAEVGAIVAAAHRLSTVHLASGRRAADALGIAYPAELATVAQQKLRSAAPRQFVTPPSGEPG